MSRKYGWRERSPRTQRLLPRQHGKTSLHFRNLHPHYKPKKQPLQFPSPIMGIDWGAAGEPCLADWCGVSGRIQTQQYWNTQLQHIIWEHTLHTLEHNTWTQTPMATYQGERAQFAWHVEPTYGRRICKTVAQSGIYHNNDQVVVDNRVYANGVRPVTEGVMYPDDSLFRVDFSPNEIFPNDYGPTDSPTFNVGDYIQVVPVVEPQSNGWGTGSTINTIQHRVGHEYWLRCSMDVVPGQIITNPNALAKGLVVAEYLGNNQWRSTQAFNAPHKYHSVWDKVQHWVSDDGLITADDYYRRVTGHVLFTNVCYTIDGSGTGRYSFQEGRREFIPNSWDVVFDPTFPWHQFPQFIPEMKYDALELNNWLFRVRHKSDRDGPCGTCRTLMETVPVVVEGILL